MHGPMNIKKDNNYWSPSSSDCFTLGAEHPIPIGLAPQQI